MEGEAKASVEQKLQHLALHVQTAHPQAQQTQPQQAPGNNSSRGKVDRPVLKPVCDQEGWEFFKYEWSNYKTAMGISGTTTSAHLYGCLDEELRKDLQKSSQGKAASDMTEGELMSVIKKLAVKQESKLAHRIKMGRSVQAPGMGIRTFFAQLKGMAAPCGYTVASTCVCGVDKTIDYSDKVIQDQLVRGIADQEILADLLGDEKTDRTTEEIVEYIARKEQAKSERGTVAGENITAGLANRKQGSKPCRGCDGPDHGGRSQRLTECPARDVTCERCMIRGHYTKKCIKCKDCQQWGHGSKKSKHCKADKEEKVTGGVNTRVDTEGFVMASLVSSISNKAEMRLATVGSRKGRTIPLTHHIFTERGWTAAQSDPHPSIEMTTSACPDDHAQFGHPIHHGSDPGSSTQTVICDTGCMSTAIPPAAAYRVGLKKKDFIPVVSRLNGVDKSDLGVIGAVVMKFQIRTDAQPLTTKQLCYVCTKVDKIYLSCAGLKQLGIVSQDFPHPDRSHIAAVSGNDSKCECKCPARPKSPPPPITSCPSHLVGDVEQMKRYLIQHYSSTVFNICECQPLPLLPGPPLRFNIEKDAEPVACHRVTPVPLHFQERVYRDLQRDVALEVIEKVPPNTPTPWLSRMLVTAKSNGDPRRVVDYQQLNKHIKRQTFPLETPFQLASRIPPMAKKTVVDNWNGYHSVEVHPDDRHYTAFLSQHGRFQYRVAAQGNMVSGDAFNARMGEIFVDFNDMVRCVDDAVIWTLGGDTESHFLRMAQYLDVCAKNNIILNPAKFQFCQDTIDFAGFQVSPTSLMPSEKMLESIRKFPTPKNISGVRAYFGLVKQVAYAFAMTEEMQPFRHLLSPKVRFEWSQELDTLFRKSKEVIIDRVSEGIRLFDPNLTTCLATDFSGKGVGFLLLQKTCSCDSKVPTCCPEGWRVCLVGSRFLHDAENRYAPIEGECLAVVYGLQKCKYFLLGCRDLVIATDHKPLINILNDRYLGDIENGRLRNMKEKTLAFNFIIKHVPGRKHLGPDAASRYPVSEAMELDLSDEPSADSECTKKEVRHDILNGLAAVEIAESNEDIAVIAGAEHHINQLIDDHTQSCCTCTEATRSSYNVITWDTVKMASEEDKDMQDLIKFIIAGFPEDARSLPSHIKPYNMYKASLYVVDNVVMMGDRIVVPRAIRQNILHILHAAHQGIDRMKARASEVVFWPGIVGDIARHREGCHACHRMAKSNPALPPHDPPEPEFPFQYLAADYFHYGNRDYCVVVDRYSHWPIVATAHQGAKGFTDQLRRIFSTYGICQEIATDGAAIFTGGLTQEFLKKWGVKHRLSSVANPHSNCRAELGVKQVKRMITDNCGPSGSLDVDSFHRAILSYRNTPDPITKVSPAVAVFGRQMRDCLPVQKGYMLPHNTWRELLDHREKAMARRHILGWEQWTEHVKKLPSLKEGDNVFLQNLMGNHPRRWDRTGRVIECKEYDQYLVKVDGSGRTTLRNRKHLRKFKPVPKAPTTQIPPPTHVIQDTPPTRGLSLEYRTTPPSPTHSMVHKSNVATPEDDTPPFIHVEIPDQSQESSQLPPATRQPLLPVSDPPEQPPHTVTDQPDAQDPLPNSGRPMRVRKQNIKLNPDEWDLSVIVEFLDVVKRLQGEGL